MVNSERKRFRYNGRDWHSYNCELIFNFLVCQFVLVENKCNVFMMFVLSAMIPFMGRRDLVSCKLRSVFWHSSLKFRMIDFPYRNNWCTLQLFVLHFNTTFLSANPLFGIRLNMRVLLNFLFKLQENSMKAWLLLPESFNNSSDIWHALAKAS